MSYDERVYRRKNQIYACVLGALIGVTIEWPLWGKVLLAVMLVVFVAFAALLWEELSDRCHDK